MMITNEIKDTVLKRLIETGTRYKIDFKQLSRDIKIDFDELDSILDHFENLGFLELEKLLGGKANVRINIPAIDFYSHGGFKGQEELLRINIEKLLLEIESLKPSFPDKVEKITSIAAGIAGALSLFIPK